MKRNSPHRLSWLRVAITLLLLIPFVLHLQGRYPLGLLEKLELFSYDMRVQTTLPGGQDNRVVIVDIDEYSLSMEGQWPWPRNKLARLVNALFNDYGIRAMGFDVVFAEPDRSSASSYLNSLGNQINDANVQALLSSVSDQLDNDTLLAQAVSNHDVALGYLFKRDVQPGEPAELSFLNPPVVSAEQIEQVKAPFVTAAGFTGNVQVLASATGHGGFFENPLMDEDGTIRRVPLLQKYQGNLYPSLALATARLALGNPPLAIAFDKGEETTFSGLDMEYVALGDNLIPVDDQAAVLVPYRGGSGSFKYISASRVLRGEADIESLFDTTVLLGSSAPGLLDLRSTPVGNQYTGVEVHANIVSGIFEQRFHHRPAYTAGLEFFMLLVIGVLLTALTPRLKALGNLALISTLIVAIVALAFFLWVHQRQVIPLATPILYCMAIFVSQLVLDYFIEARSRDRLETAFGKYVPAAVVKSAEASQEKLALVGESRDMTVLFADVHGYSTLAETLSPEDLAERMNMLWSPVAGAVESSGGTIDKYMGDAIMAFWGAPDIDPHHADNAIDCALRILATIRQVNQQFSARGWPAIEVGIGINSGKMHVGNMGAEQRMTYTVMGDAVNLASRLEKVSRDYPHSIIIGDGCHGFVNQHRLSLLDSIKVKGRNTATKVYTVEHELNNSMSYSENLQKDFTF